MSISPSPSLIGLGMIGIVVASGALARPVETAWFKGPHATAYVEVAAAGGPLYFSVEAGEYLTRDNTHPGDPYYSAGAVIFGNYREAATGLYFTFYKITEDIEFKVSGLRTRASGTATGQWCTYSYPDPSTCFDDTITFDLDFVVLADSAYHEVISTRRDFGGTARLFESREMTTAAASGGTSSVTSSVFGSFPIPEGSAGTYEGKIVLHLGN